MTRSRFFWFGLPPVLVAATIFALSSQSSLPAPDVVGWDKLAHALAFGTLSLTCGRALFAYGRSRLTAAVLGAAIAIVYGLTDELHQASVPGRSPDVLDLVADAVGAMVAAFVWFRWWRPR